MRLRWCAKVIAAIAVAQASVAATAASAPGTLRRLAGSTDQRLPAHATAFPFETRAKAIAGHRTRSDRFLLLNGHWSFAFSPGPASAPPGFERPDYDTSSWQTIEVPAFWRSQGHDRAGCAAAAVGSYRRDIDLPAGWRGQDVILHIGAAGPTYRVWMNGEAVGEASDAALPSEFDVTRHLKPGRNVIAIEVRRPADSDGPAGLCLAGIEREVFLMAAPKTRIRDIFVHAGLSGDRRQGRLAIDVAVTPGGATEARYLLLDEDRVVLAGRTAVPPGPAERIVTLHGRLAGVRPWAAETPTLYFLLVELYDRRGGIIQSSYQRIGFRTVTFTGGVVRVNGRPVAIRGAAPYGDNCRTAEPASHDRMERDVRALQQAGVTTVRIAHRPADPYLYDLADRYGLYVIDQPSHPDAADSSSKDRPSMRRVDQAEQHAAVRRVIDLIERDKNHPSVIAWSLAGRTGMPAAARAAARRDPERPMLRGGADLPRDR